MTEVAADVKVHPTAIIEPGVEIGSGTSVWDNAHIRSGAKIGRQCIVGEKSYIAYGVQIGNHVKINSFVYICHGVTVQDFVMISAGVVFTNDKFPRAFLADMKGLATSAPTEETLSTFVRRGATIGANATIGCGLEIGEFAMVGMGSVVTRSIPGYHLFYGNPARHQGFVCRCGHRLENFSCKHCYQTYLQRDGKITPR